jgi:formylmethanofuran dehydrogenase subunit E
MSHPPFDDYPALLDEAGRFHGHVCGGISTGVRMAMAGLRRLGLTDPRGKDRKRLLVLVEMDRCAADAIMTATGCSPGKRSLKILDHGKMAATFVDLETGRAVRVAAGPPPPEGQELDYATAPDERFLTLADVRVELRPEDLPGKPVRVVTCAACGERVLDGREVQRGDRALCRPCAEGRAYYRPAASTGGA